MQTATLTLTDFLLARISEDEADARGAAEAEVPTVSLAHIARWHPDRVLAECEAKRGIVAEHPAHVAASGFWTQTPKEPSAHCETCGDPYGWDQTPPVEWPCPTLRALALPYADHPEHRSEWRP